ncbi:MAG: polyisoprenoid-binding protein [Micavibrio aeruginosavorus]|uniref:Polyisoprenoid-binding protein n=1 Tax=Micavibrio aeruginosavorus TaxID=349221 RepID=A0A2W5N1N1_9BACT|nr:MAG: polyisoprenoid-binding protein [Micavibrio aeruginosavorus]
MSKTLLGLLAVAALFGSTTAHAADTYAFDPTHTSVIWSAVHFGNSSPHGIFSNIEGSLTLDEANPAASKLDVTVPIDKLATGIDKFNTHLLSKDFFNVAEFPTAKFVSTKVEKTGDKTAKVTGDLTLVGVTKPVTLDVTFNNKGINPMNKKETVGFSASGVIKRSEFGIKYALPNVSDDVVLEIEAEANK